MSIETQKNKINKKLSSKVGLISALGASLAIGFFVSCGSEEPEKKKAEKPPLVFPKKPTNPTSSNGNNNVNTNPTGLDAKWEFTGFSCTAGELTPWAKLENDLVSKEGFKSGLFKWNRNTSDNGIIKRSHEWNIFGNTAIRETTLSFFSNSNAQGDESGSSVSTKKRYKVKRITNGRLILEHGKTEGPFFQGLPMNPVLAVVTGHIDKQKQAGKIPAFLLKPIENIQNFLKGSFSNEFTSSIMSFVDEVSEATETLNYTFSDSKMSFNQAKVNIKGFTSAPGASLVDFATCGPDGKATRSYKRVGKSVPLF